MSSDPGFHHPRHIAEWLWLEQVLKPAEVELPEKELVSPTEPESPPEEELAPEPAESPIPEESEDEEETEPEDSEQTPAREAGLTEGGGDDDSPEGESGMPSAARKHSITALPQLEDTLAYSRALHRVIPLRAVPGSQEIDVHATVQRSAASGGVIDPVVVEKSERRGHLIIIEAGSLSFDPWRASIEKLADLARTVGSFRDVQMIRLPLPSGGAEQPGLPQDEQNSDPQSKALDELSMALRPGRPTLVLLAHDGVDDSIEDGQLGHYLDQQVRRIDREARIAWLHPWPEMQWSHTAVEGLFRRGLTSQIDGELVLPVIPLGLKRAGLAPLDHPRPGLAHLEGWLDGQGMIGVPAYGVPILDEDAVQDTSTIDDDFPLDEEFADEVAEEGDEEPDWEDVFQRFVSSTTEEAARMLGAAAAASVVSSLSIPFLEVICAVNDKTVATSAEDSRFAVASAITSGFFERASRPPGQVGSDDAPNKDDEMPRLRFCGKSKEVIRQHLTPETVGRVLHSLKDQSFTDPAGIDLRDEIHWKLLSRLTGEDDLPEGTEIGPSIDPDHFRWAAMLLNHEAEQIDTWIETDITPGTKKVPVAIVDGPTGESEVTDPIVEPDAAEEDRFENW
ncbi:MAG: hypothetical protein OSB12_10275, partial [Planctomycetota bacterium]|nr:hypothetical protein [Planctomycetota bacterium]